ncbi:MAG: PIG-L deacetylase family protein [Chloroflexota bacterium]|nr:PIG-L deacetylase family protein [Chloroflexota bacterium]
MRILVFSAHSADFCSRAGGTIARYVQEGHMVRVVALSFGERSESGGLYGRVPLGSDIIEFAEGEERPSLEEVRRIRQQEATQAAEILGADIRFLNWGDLSFEYSSERAKLLAVEIRDFQPDVVLTHHGPDPRSVDHDTTYNLVKRATQMTGAAGLEVNLPPHRRPETFLFEATIPLTELEGFNPDFYVDVTDVWDIKHEALGAFHRGQPFLLPWYTDVAKRRAFQAQRLAGRTDIEYAEAFERTSPWVGRELPLNTI